MLVGVVMRKLALNVGRLGQIAIIAVCLVFATGQMLPVLASAPTLQVPQTMSIVPSASSEPFSDSFDVSGFASSATLLITLSVSGMQGASISIPATSGLTLEYGYWSWTNVSSISFTGQQASVNNALDSLTFQSGNMEGSATVSISVQEKQSGTFFYEGTGNLYKYFPSYGISYQQAKQDAATSTLNGITGHLVAITSQGEQNFVNSKIQGATNIWIAASDTANEGIWTVDAGPENGQQIWIADGRVNGWVNDSTTYSYGGGTTVSGAYSNWCGGEPNNSDYWNNGEDHAVTNWNGDTCWNDLSEFNVWSIGGYVAEYESGALNTTILSASVAIVSSSAPTTTSSTTTEPPSPTTVAEPVPTTTEPAPTTTDIQNPETTTSTVEPSPPTTESQPEQSSTSTSSTTPEQPTPPNTTSTSTTIPWIAPVVVPVPEEEAPSTSSPEIDESQEDQDRLPTNTEPPDPSQTIDPETEDTSETTVPTTVSADSYEESLPEREDDVNISDVVSSLEDFSVDEAEAFFESIDANDISTEEAALLVAAVQDAPVEVREVFENTVDLFSGVFDDYMMLGSTITVGQRRTVVAVTAMTIAVGTNPVPLSGGNGTPKRPDSNTYARKSDEDEEPSGEIAGDGLEWTRKIRIFKNVDGVVVVDWKAFFRKFSYGIMNMGFTLAGSLVVFLTLSGTLQKIAGVATVLAFVAALWLHMKEPEGE